MQSNYIQSLINKNKHLEQTIEELEAMKAAYAELISPHKIGDIIKSDSFDNTEIKIINIKISNIFNDNIELKLSGYARKQNGEFGLRVLTAKKLIPSE
ncbi:hypothetical protein QV08_01115 [Gallibacterium salpingitidis]|uniref:Uncharacterized protein n=1 Tax=Gallibacterium salpingitidis TaxID=505341 RepID=A0AB36E2M8_9PAST|nr:hypothetical protein [Gallibacterium salpingitidis]OBX09574.1 hypothetical protein QV08_01115 [Gallibacterium salpingitidis]OBX10430.1 hypothetical protein QV09_05670 [Gallibacterium salpingitidis]